MKENRELKKWSDQLWTVQKPLKFFGLHLGTRMTIIKMDDGGIWIHSPIEPSDQLVDKINNLGKVKHIVAPNKFHHLFVGQFKSRFPEANIFGAKGLSEKRKDLSIDWEFDQDSSKSPWLEIETLRLAGMRYLNEVVFFHKKSKSLILTDLGFNLSTRKPWLTRIFCRINGIYGRFGCPLDVKLLLISDKQKFQNSIEKISSWDFDRIIMAHGNVVNENAKNIFLKAFINN